MVYSIDKMYDFADIRFSSRKFTNKYYVNAKKVTKYLGKTIVNNILCLYELLKTYIWKWYWRHWMAGRLVGTPYVMHFKYL